MSRSARAPCVPKHFCACWGRSRIASLTCSPAAVRPTGAMARIPIVCTSTSSLQVILKPTPDDVIDQYLGSLKAIGIDLSKHDIKFEEDNWESPTLGAWGIGWQVMLDGLEITQFTYFQQCGGIDLDLVPAETDVWPGAHLCAFLQGVESVYDIEWAPGREVLRSSPGGRGAVLGLQLRDGQRGSPVAPAWRIRSRVQRAAGRIREVSREAPLSGAGGV